MLNEDDWGADTTVSEVGITQATIDLDDVPEEAERVEVFANGDQIFPEHSDETGDEDPFFWFVDESTLSIGNLAADTSYEVTIQVLDGEGEQIGDGPTVTFETLALEEFTWPDGAEATVTDTTDESVTLEWPEAEPAAEVTFYYVFVEDEEGDIVSTSTFERNETGQFVLAGNEDVVLSVENGQLTYETQDILTPDTIYEFDIDAQIATQSVNRFVSENDKLLTTTGTTGELSQPEWDDTGARVGETTETTVEIEVDEYPIDVEYIQEFVFYDDETGAELSTDGEPDALTQTLEELTPETEYDVRVEVRNIEGQESDDGPVVTVTTDSTDRPSSLTADADRTTVTLEWDGPDSGVYQISRDSEVIETLDADNLTTLTYEDSDRLEPNQEYTYDVVRIIDGVASEPVSTTTTTGVVSATVKASVRSDGSTTSHDARDAVLSGDGRYLVHSSGGTEDTSERIYRHDLETGERLEITPAGVFLEWDSYETPFVNPTVNEDGSVVAFDTLDGDIFLYDVTQGSTELVSGYDDTGVWTEGGGVSVNPSISADGRYVAFESSSETLVSGAEGNNVFVFDRETEEMTAVEVGNDELGTADPSISPDGNSVVFQSDNHDLVPELPGDLPDGQTNVFHYDIDSDEITWISQPTDGATPDGDSTSAAVSEDGTHVVFLSDATGLTDDSIGTTGVYLSDSETGELELLSLDSEGEALDARAPDITPDGQYVAFNRFLVNTEHGTVSDFGYNNTGERWERTWDGEIPAARDISISDDGSAVGYRIDISVTGTTNVVSDDDSNADAFVTFLGNDTLTETPTWAPDAIDVEPAADWVDIHVNDPIGDVKYHVVYEGDDTAGDIVGHGDGDGVRIDDLEPETEYEFRIEAMNQYGIYSTDGPTISVTTEEVATPPMNYTAYDRGLVLTWDHPPNGEGQFYTVYRVEADGTRTDIDLDTWNSAMDTGLEPGTTYDYELEFYDSSGMLVEKGSVSATTLSAGEGIETEQANLNPQGQGVDDRAYAPALSADGDVVVFESIEEPLIDGLAEEEDHIYVRDESGTELISVNSAGEPANDRSDSPDISDDGNLVVFRSQADNLDARADEESIYWQVYLHNRQTGETELISQSYDGQSEADSQVYDPAISGDGRYVTFVSYADDLTEDEAPATDLNIYVHDIETGETELVTAAYDGGAIDDDSYSPRISEDGRFVVFESDAQTLLEEYTSPDRHIFVWDREADAGDQIRQVSVMQDGTQLEDGNHDPDISDDGRYVVFHTESDETEVGGTTDTIQLWDRETGELLTVSESATGGSLDSGPERPVISGDGQFVAWESGDDTLTPVPIDGGQQVYLRNLETDELWLVSVSSDGEPADHRTSENLRPAINGDGSYVAYESSAETLTPDADGSDGVFRTQINHAMEPPVWPGDGTLETDATGQTFVALSWPDAENTVSEYRIAKDGEVIATTSAGTTSYIVDDLDPETEYTFTVKAGGSGQWTAPLETTVETRDGGLGNAGLFVDVKSNLGTELFWDPAPDELSATGFEVQRQTAGDGWETVTAIEGPGITEATDTGLLADTTYEYRVLVVDSEGQTQEHTLTASVTTTSLQLSEFSWFVPDQSQFGYIEREGEIGLTVVGEPDQTVTVDAEYSTWYDGDQLLPEPEHATKRVELVEDEPGIYHSEEFTLPAGAASLTALTANLTDGEDVVTETETDIDLKVFGSLNVSVFSETTDIEDIPADTKIQVWSDELQHGVTQEFDGEGAYRFDGLMAVDADALADPDDAYEVRLRAGGSSWAVVSGVSVEAGVENPMDDDSIELTYDGPTEVFVQVEDHNGNQLGGVDVRAYADPLWLGSKTSDEVDEVRVFSSDSSTRHANAEEIRLVADSRLPNQDSVETTVELEPGRHEVTLQLPEPKGVATVSGVVTDQHGEPVENTTVVSTQSFRRLSGTETYRVSDTTGADGTYEMDVLPGETTVSAAKYYSTVHRDAADVAELVLEPEEERTLDFAGLEEQRWYEFSVGSLSYHDVGGEVQTFTSLGGSEAANFQFRVSGEHVPGMRASRHQGGYPLKAWLPVGEEVEMSIDGRPIGLVTLTETAILGDESLIRPEFEFPADAIAGTVQGRVLLPDGRLWERTLPNIDRNAIISIYDEDGVRVTRDFSPDLDVNLPEPGTYQLRVQGVHDGSEHFASQQFTLEDDSDSKNIGDIQMLPGGRFGFQDGNSVTGNPVEVAEGSYSTVRVAYNNTGSDSVTDAQLNIDLPGHMSLTEGSVLHDGESTDASVEDQQVTVELGELAGDESGVVHLQVTAGEITDPRDDELTATISFDDDGEWHEEWMGSVEFQAGSITIDVPETVNDRELTLQGRAPGESNVRIYADGQPLGETDVAPNGYWSMSVTLPDDEPPVWHRLQAEATTEEGQILSPGYNVLYEPEEPHLQELTMWQSDEDEDWEAVSTTVASLIRDSVTHPTTFSTTGGVPRFPRIMIPGLPFKFELEFSDPNRVSDVVVGVEGSTGGSAEAEFVDGTWVAKVESSKVAGGGTAGRILVDYETDTPTPSLVKKGMTAGDDALSLTNDPVDLADDAWAWEDDILVEDEDSAEEPPGPAWTMSQPLHFADGDVTGEMEMEFSTGHGPLSGDGVVTGYYGMTQGETTEIPDDSDAIYSQATVNVRQATDNQTAITVSTEIPLQEFIDMDPEPDTPPEWDEEAELSLTDMSNDGERIDLVWNPAQDSLWVEEYRIYHDDGENRVLLAETFGDTFETELDGLEPGEEYTLQVEAVNAHGEESSGGPTVQLTAGDPDSVMNTAQLSDFKQTSEEFAEPMWQASLRTTAQGGENWVRTTTRLGLKGLGPLDAAGVAKGAWDASNDIERLDRTLENLPPCAQPPPAELQQAVNDAKMMSRAEVGNSAAFAAAGALTASGIGVPGGVLLAAVGTASNLAVGHQRDQAHQNVEEELAKAFEDIDDCERDRDPRPGTPVGDPAWKIDPSGFVYEVTEDNVVEGVTATVLKWDEEDEMWREWDAEWWGEQNPQTTDAGGMYGWDVPPGDWRVVYEKDGYETAYSQDHYEDPIEVPPPHFDVNVPIRSLEPPEIEAVSATDDMHGIEVTFNRHIKKVTASTSTVQVKTLAGELVAGEIQFDDVAADPHTDSDEETLALTVRFESDEPLSPGDYQLVLSELMESYADVPLAGEYQTTVEVQEPETPTLLLDSDLVELDVGESQSLTAMALFENGTTTDVTTDVDWHSTDESVATIEAGIVTAAGTGSTEITASHSDFESASVQVSVVDSSGEPAPDEPTPPESTSPPETGTGPVTEISVESIPGGAVATVADARAGEPASVAFAGGVGGASSLDRLVVTPGVDGDFDVTVTAADELPARLDALSNEAETLLYFDIESSLDADDIEDVTFEFTVSGTELAEYGIEPSDVALFHSVDGEWTERESVVVEANGDVTVEAATPHFSGFALAGKQSSIAVLDYDVPAVVAVDDGLSVDVELENTGGATGTEVIELSIDGEVVTETVTLGPGERTVITLTYPVDEAGEFEVGVNDELGTVVTVEDARDQRPDDSGPEDEPGGDDDDSKQQQGEDDSRSTADDGGPGDGQVGDDGGPGDGQLDDSGQQQADGDGSLGFGVVLGALVALVAVAMLTRRHRTI